MNILFLTIARLKNINESGIFTDLINEFKNKGHNVYVACASQKKYSLETEYTNEHNINMLRVKVGNLTKVGSIEKGISTLMIEKYYLKAIKKYYKKVKFDLVIYPTPPITFDKVIRYIKNRDGAITYLLLKDIFPQNAVDLKMFSNKSLFYYYFRKKELKLYENSDYIGCMSHANAKYILNNYSNISESKVEVNPNTIKPRDIKISDGQKEEIQNKYNLPQDKSIFIYGGNLGRPQGIDFLIECIQKNERNKGSYFLIVGSGTEFNKLESYFKSEQPKNAKLLSQLPKNDYELLANTCDVGLIFLDNRFTIPNFPSRLLSYMQASMPVLAATDSNTDIGKIIEEGNFGYGCISDDVKKFNDLVIQLSDKKLQKKMGGNARKYLEENYKSQHSYDIIMSHFN